MDSLESYILRELLTFEGDYISGSALAKKLGISRVAIWQHMENLRAQGYIFEAVRARGYRLISKPDRLDAALVRAYLPLRNRTLTLTVLDSVDSTNDEAARELAGGRSAPFVIIAREQTQGRGRLGRQWMSEPNGNLYLSFAFRPKVATRRMPTFTLWMGANLCELIANFCRISPGLKWPNDINFGGLKAGGMLTEARLDADEIRDLVFGLGLNLRTPPGGWPEPLRALATSLEAQAAAPVDVNKFTAAVIGRILLAYEKFVEGLPLGVLADMWNRHDILRRQRIHASLGGRQLSGIASGIDDEGALLLRTDQGGIERLRAGEVTLSPPTNA